MQTKRLKTVSADYSTEVIIKQEEKLVKLSRQLHEKTPLQYSTEKMLTESNYSRSVGNSWQQGDDSLLRKLVEIEEHGIAAAKQVSVLHETVSKLCFAGSSRLSASDCSVLAHQKELLLLKLGIFEATNKNLQHLLRWQRESQMEASQVSEQKDTRKKTLSDTANAWLLVKHQEKDSEISELSDLLETEKDNSKSRVSFIKSLESDNAHLQGQLRSQQAEKNQLVVQLQNMDREIIHQKREMELLREQVLSLKQQARADREAQKQAMQAQKQQTKDSEEKLRVQLQDMEEKLANALSAAESWKSRHAEEMKDKNELETEVLHLNSHVEELTEQLDRADKEALVEKDALLDHVDQLTSDSTASKLENRSLKITVSEMEEKMAASETDIQQLKDCNKEYESLLGSFKTQIAKAQAETNEYSAQLEALKMKNKMEEMENIYKGVQGHLREIDPLAKHSHVQMTEAQINSCNQENVNPELSMKLMDFHTQEENKNSQMELLRQKNNVWLEENRQLEQRQEMLEREYESAGSQKSKLLAVFSKEEDNTHNVHSCLEEKTKDYLLLSCRMKEALNDTQQISVAREHTATTEPFMKSGILQVYESIMTEIKQLRHSKEEMEQRYQCRLKDFEHRLEESENVNQDLQSYLQFLRDSYKNLFGDLQKAPNCLLKDWMPW